MKLSLDLCPNVFSYRGHWISDIYVSNIFKEQLSISQHAYIVAKDWFIVNCWVLHDHNTLQILLSISQHVSIVAKIHFGVNHLSNDLTCCRVFMDLCNTPDIDTLNHSTKHHHAGCSPGECIFGSNTSCCPYSAAPFCSLCHYCSKTCILGQLNLCCKNATLFS